MANKNSLQLPAGARNNIGGAIITRGFTLPANAPEDVRQPGNRDRARVGRFLSAELVRSMKNRRALEDGGFIKVAAVAPAGDIERSLRARIAQLEAELAQAKVAKPANGEQRFRYAFHTGAGKFDVIDGLRLNSGPLTKDKAAELCKGHEAPTAA